MIQVTVRSRREIIAANDISNSFHSRYLSDILSLMLVRETIRAAKSLPLQYSIA